MDLATYLAQTGESQTSFASRVQTALPNINRIVSGKMRPGLDLAYRIEKQTQGLVPLSQWVGWTKEAA